MPAGVASRHTANQCEAGIQIVVFGVITRTREVLRGARDLSKGLGEKTEGFWAFARSGP